MPLLPIVRGGDFITIIARIREGEACPLDGAHTFQIHLPPCSWLAIVGRPKRFFVAVIGQTAGMIGSFAAGSGRRVFPQHLLRGSFSRGGEPHIRPGRHHGRLPGNELRRTLDGQMQRCVGQTVGVGPDNRAPRVIGTEFHRRLPVADGDVAVRAERNGRPRRKLARAGFYAQRHVR